MRRPHALALLLLVSPAFAGLTLPEGGLPAGRIAAGPVVAARAATAGTAGLFLNFMRGAGSSLPGAAELKSLDNDAARYAAGALLGEVPPALWAKIFEGKDLGPDGARIAAQFAPYLEEARAKAAAGNADVLARLQREIDAGRLGSQDLEDAAAALRGLAAHNASLKSSLEAVASAVESQKRKQISEIVAESSEWKDGKESAPVAALESSRDTGRLERSTAVKRRVGTALKIGGAAVLAAAAVAALHPQWLPHIPAAWQGALTWGGAALATAGRFFAMPRGPPPSEVQAPAKREFAGWIGAVVRTGIRLGNLVSNFKQLFRTAAAGADVQKNLEGKVGDGSWNNFVKWISGAARTAVQWFPLALAGMLGGAVLGKLPGLLTAKANAAVAAASSTLTPEQAHGILSTSWGSFFNGYVAQMVLQSVLLMGVGYNGLKWGLAKVIPARFKPKWIAAALTLAGFAAFLAFTGFPAAMISSVVGIQAVSLYLYERSGSLWAAAGVQGIIALLGLESSRMLAGISVAATGTLVGLPAWGGLALLGLISAAAIAASKLHLWTFLKSQGARLKEVGEDWMKPTPDGAPKSPLRILATGLMWALPLYLAMDFTAAGIHHFLPQTDPVPEILKRMIMSPFDAVLYNFVIVAALEEWVFRKGLFKPIREKLKKWVSPAKSWFWPAAIASSLIFSGAHYIDWSHPLAQFGIGHADVSSALAGAYAFTWSSFFARAAGGMMLCFLYARSGLILVPMIAHFGSNVLESIGMRWGIVPFLATAAGVLALQWLAQRKKPASS